MEPGDDEGYEVREATGEDELLPPLSADRTWCAYALCDLDPRYRTAARFVVARDGTRPRGVALLYTLPQHTVLFLHGANAVLSALMAQLTDAPREVMLSVRPGDLTAVARRYEVQQSWTMRRMALAPRDLREPRRVEARLAPLSGAHADEVRALLDEHDAAVFSDDMLADDTYVGAWLDGRLAALAGTHAVSWRYGLAAVGNVYTRPEYRGRGLAQATTHAVVAALGRRGVRDVVLNADERNAPALSAYRRLGFADCGPFVEGTARLTTYELK